MLNKTALLAAAILAISASVAGAQTTYNISITGACDTLSLTLDTDGVVVGQSNKSGCDYSNMIGYQAKLKKDVGPGGKVLIAAGDLGLEPDAWDWAFNLKTLTATLTGTPDGTTVDQGNFSFTFTTGANHVKPANNGKPSATSIVRSLAGK
jgi:hypothetical protein